jgi:hypothetical protein
MGIIILDVTEFQALSAYPNLIMEIIMHEIGHVLGIGSFWEPNIDYIELTTDGYYGFPYQHQYANDAHVNYGGLGSSARVEDGGGAGTKGVHWDESTYDYELMTGYVEAGMVSNKLSQITIGALRDIGYAVNLSAADFYVLPRRRLRGSLRHDYVGCLKFNITYF